jgi:hypothetical protein
MLARKERIAVPDQYHLDRGHEWLVQLYQAWGSRTKPPSGEKGKIRSGKKPRPGFRVDHSLRHRSAGDVKTPLPVCEKLPGRLAFEHPFYCALRLPWV